MKRKINILDPHTWMTDLRHISDVMHTVELSNKNRTKLNEEGVKLIIHDIGIPKDPVYEDYIEKVEAVIGEYWEEVYIKEQQDLKEYEEFQLNIIVNDEMGL